MKQIRNILLAIDGKYQRQALVAEVAAVAENTGAQVTLLGILDIPSGVQTADAETADLRQWMKEDRLEEIKDISSEFVKRGIQVTVKQANGKPYLEIIREAQKENYDLIMKPAASETGIKDVLFGGTDLQLFRLCPYPVWVFKPTFSGRLNNIMIAVDLLPSDPEKSALADTVLQWGKYISQLFDARLHVIHAWELYGELTLRGRSILANTVDRLVLKEEQAHRQWLKEALERNGITQKDVHLHLHKGEAKKLIPIMTKTLDIDLLVMGTVGRTGIPGFFIGNTADSVLRQVGCSVLAIKPQGFITPVE